MLKTHRNRERSLIWAVRLFLFMAAILFVGGVGIPVAFRLGRGQFLLFTPRYDRVHFGRAPADIIAREPAVLEVQFLYIDLVATLLLICGVLLASVTWFGLRRGHRWAWWSIFFGFVAGGASLARTVLPYHLEAALGIGDVPPLLWLAVIAPVALVLGWRGTRGRT